MPTSLTKPDFITPQECLVLANVMTQKYASSMGERRFEVEASKDSFGIYVKILLRNNSGSFYYPVEGRISNRDHDLSLRDATSLVFDYIDSYFAEYFREGDVYLPIDWAEYECDGIPIQLRGQILNLEIERMADDWLAGDSAPTHSELH